MATKQNASARDTVRLMGAVDRTLTGHASRAPLQSLTIRIGDRRLDTSPVFDTYWRFAAARHSLFEARMEGTSGPWTADPILQTFKFTNSFRAADRVSQYLIRNVIYDDDLSDKPEDVVFRVLLFKLFNKVSTWETLVAQVGEPSWTNFDFDSYADGLDRAAEHGPIYSAAYVIPPPRLFEASKRRNHLRLLEALMNDGFAELVDATDSLGEVYEALLGYPSLGRFLAFQFAIDLNYTTVLNADENDFVVAGPGACDGIRKCFGAASSGLERELIEYMVETQDEHFERLGIEFAGLYGRKLHLIDCQNLFCEVDKYSRVAHPEVAGISGRARIKQKYRPTEAGFSPFFPPKWGIGNAVWGAAAGAAQQSLWAKAV